MKRKKNVKVHWGNLFLLLVVILVFIFGGLYLYNKLNNNDNGVNNGTNEVNEKADDKKLTKLGYSKSDAETLLNNLDKSTIDKIDKKYDNLVEYSKVKYFHIENIDRYDSYKDKNSSMSISEVIMNVNISLDKEFYSDIKTVKDPDDTLVLVNKYYGLPSGIEPKHLVNIEGEKMESVAADAMKKMISDLRSTGLHIILQSGYRSEETQSIIYNRNVTNRGKERADKYSARPNHSEHQTGLAMDLSTDGTLEETFENTKQFAWLQENAHKYGFIMRYPKDKVYMTGYGYEPWHYRYVGVEIATLIKNEGITFEEYYVKYKGLY